MATCYSCRREVAESEVVKCRRETRLFSYCPDCAHGALSTCAFCGHKIFSGTRLLGRNSEHPLIVCTHCFNNHQVPCEACGADTVPFSSIYMGNLGKFYHRVCWEQKWFTCAHCGHTYNRSEVRIPTGTNYTLCPGCFPALYRECDQCHRTVRRGEFCQSCNRCRQCCTCLHIGHYHTKPPLTFSGAGKGSIHLGVELEMETGEHTQACIQAASASGPGNGKIIYLEHDGSIGNGFELITHPCTLEYHQQSFGWEALCQALIRAGARSHDTSSCGLHVHASLKGFRNIAEKCRLSIFCYSHVPDIVRLARREPNQYCRVPEGKVRASDQGAYESASRYELVNWTNSHTVEFRAFRGTLKWTTVLACIEFCDAAIRYSRDASAYKLARPDGFERFLDWAGKDGGYPNLLAYYRPPVAPGEASSASGAVPGGVVSGPEV